MRSLRAVLVLAVALLLVGGVAACGGDDDSSTESSDASTTTSTSEPSEESSTTTTTSEDSGDTHEAGTAGVLRVEDEGVALLDDTGTVLESFAFGEVDAATVSMEVDQHLAEQGESTELSECGEGPMVGVRYTGLGLYFQEDLFVGWAVNGEGSDAYRTADDIGIGSTKGDLNAAYGGEVSVEETSLGFEFQTMFGLSGTLTSDGQDATIDAMWSGSTCIAR